MDYEFDPTIEIVAPVPSEVFEMDPTDPKAEPVAIAYQVERASAVLGVSAPTRSMIRSATARVDTIDLGKGDWRRSNRDSL